MCMWVLLDCEWRFIRKYEESWLWLEDKEVGMYLEISSDTKIAASSPSVPTPSSRVPTSHVPR